MCTDQAAQESPHWQRRCTITCTLTFLAAMPSSNLGRTAAHHIYQGGRPLCSQWFLIIMTSRDRSLLTHKAHQRVERQPAQLLADGDDEKMLCLHAFGQPAPPEKQAHLVKPVVDACHGLPLVLEVVGAYLHQKEDITWTVSACNFLAAPPVSRLWCIEITYLP